MTEDDELSQNLSVLQQLVDRRIQELEALQQLDPESKISGDPYFQVEDIIRQRPPGFMQRFFRLIQLRS